MRLKVPLADDILPALTFQDYLPRPGIEGVTLTDLCAHRALNGSFMELFRVTGGILEGSSPAFSVRQASLSVAAPHRINAFHLHPKLPQSELWCVIQGLMLVWLVDCREASASKGVRQPVLLSGQEPAFLRIPPGVAHGYKAGWGGATLLYLTDQQFDPSDPNEGRLPWDHFGAELWEDDRG